MIEALQFEFMQNALAAGILTSIACGIIGTLIVVNRLVFLSGGIAHSAYGGIGLAIFFRLALHGRGDWLRSFFGDGHGSSFAKIKTSRRHHNWGDVGDGHGLRHPAS